MHCELLVPINPLVIKKKDVAIFSFRRELCSRGSVGCLSLERTPTRPPSCSARLHDPLLGLCMVASVIATPPQVSYHQVRDTTAGADTNGRGESADSLLRHRGRPRHCVARRKCGALREEGDIFCQFTRSSARFRCCLHGVRVWDNTRLFNMWVALRQMEQQVFLCHRKGSKSVSGKGPEDVQMVQRLRTLKTTEVPTVRSASGPFLFDQQ